MRHRAVRRLRRSAKPEEGDRGPSAQKRQKEQAAPHAEGASEFGVRTELPSGLLAARCPSRLHAGSIVHEASAARSPRGRDGQIKLLPTHCDGRHCHRLDPVLAWVHLDRAFGSGNSFREVWHMRSSAIAATCVLIAAALVSPSMAMAKGGNGPHPGATHGASDVAKPDVVKSKPAAKPDVVKSKPAAKPDVVKSKPAAKPDVVKSKPAAKPDVVKSKPAAKPDVVKSKPAAKPDVVKSKPAAKRPAKSPLPSPKKVTSASDARQPAREEPSAAAVEQPEAGQEPQSPAPEQPSSIASAGRRAPSRSPRGPRRSGVPLGGTRARRR